MAKGKPTRAFLEALKQDKKRRGDDQPGGGFKTPEWFFKNQAQQATTTPAAEPPAGPMPIRPRGAYPYKWTHGAAAAGVVLVLVSIAYLAGRNQNTPELSPPTEQLRMAAPQGGVLEPVDRTTVATTPPAPIPAQPVRNVQTVPPVAPETPAAAAPGKVERVVGLNYVVVQSYKDEKLAQEAAAAMRAAGLGCTVEHGLPGYSSSWYVVVGTEGFARPSTPEYHAYVRKVQEIGEKFAGSSKWKRFDPNPYRWR